MCITSISFNKTEWEFWKNNNLTTWHSLKIVVCAATSLSHVNVCQILCSISLLHDMLCIRGNTQQIIDILLFTLKGTLFFVDWFYWVTLQSVSNYVAVFENKDKIVIVMEYASKGELYDYISERRRLTERETRHFFRQIVSAVHYCHKVLYMPPLLPPDLCVKPCDLRPLFRATCAWLF